MQKLVGEVGKIIIRYQSKGKDAGELHKKFIQMWSTFFVF